MKKVEFVFIAILFLLLMACGENGLFRDDKLSIKKQNYVGDGLKFNGFYYAKHSRDSTLAEILFFYRDGVVLKDITSFNDMEAEISSRDYRNFKQYKTDWGVYKIQDTIIHFEYWGLSQVAYPAIKKIGKISSDTTFSFNSCVMGKGEQPCNMKGDGGIEFHFRAFSPKPDSTNDFIE